MVLPNEPFFVRKGWSAEAKTLQHFPLVTLTARDQQMWLSILPNMQQVLAGKKHASASRRVKSSRLILPLALRVESLTALFDCFIFDRTATFCSTNSDIGICHRTSLHHATLIDLLPSLRLALGLVLTLFLAS